MCVHTESDCLCVHTKYKRRFVTCFEDLCSFFIMLLYLCICPVHEVYDLTMSFFYFLLIFLLLSVNPADARSETVINSFSLANIS